MANIAKWKYVIMINNNKERKNWQIFCLMEIYDPDIRIIEKGKTGKYFAKWKYVRGKREVRWKGGGSARK